MDIKKLIAAGAVISAFILTGCGKSVNEINNTSAAKEPAPSEITSAIMAEITVPSAVEKDKSNIEAYYEIDAEKTEALSVFICGSGAYPDELAVFKMNSEADAQSAGDAVQKRLDSQTELYSDYTPNEMYKLDDAKVVVKGKYVMLFVCTDDSRAREIADSLF